MTTYDPLNPPPLTWNNLTRPSKIMFPTYIILFIIIGINYIFAPQDRLKKSPGLAYADSLMDLRVWGSIFIVASFLMALAFLTRSRVLFSYALNLSAICMLIWTVVITAAAWNGTASPSGWSWPAFVMAACIASNRSLSGER